MLPYTIQPNLQDARRTAQERGLRERVCCYITRARRDVLVFEHDARYPEAGVQVPAGGVDSGETLEQAAAREAFEETGLEHLSAPVYLGSALHDGWQPPQMQHYFWLEAENTAPDAWDHFAEGQYMFHHRFEPIGDAVIHWGLDALIPELERRLNLPVTPSRNNAVPVAVCYITRVQDSVPELLVLHGHPDGGVQVVAGGIDDGETPEQAAIREAWEEAGLRLEHPMFLGRAEYHFKGSHPDTSEPLEMHEDRYFYHFNTTEPRDSWDHVVSAGEDDGGKVFHHQFVKLEDARLDWDLGRLFPILEHLARWQPVTDEENAKRLITRLERCVGSPEHPLFQKKVQPIYFTERSDDVVFRVLETNQLARVHLTTKLETDPQWPWTNLFDTLEAWSQFEREDIAYAVEPQIPE